MEHELFVSLKLGDRVEVRQPGEWVRGVIDKQQGEIFVVKLDGYGCLDIDFTSEVRRLS